MTGVQAKKKSLTRRKNDASDVLGALDHIVNQTTLMLEFIKALIQGASKGRDLYDKLCAYAESDGTQPSDKMWMRCLRAVAFEDNRQNKTKLSQTCNLQMIQQLLLRLRLKVKNCNIACRISSWLSGRFSSRRHTLAA